MNVLLDLAGPWTRAVLGVGVDVAVRSSVVIALALVLHGLLGRKRVLVRSVLWNACLLGLLALPAALGVMPRVRVSWWPERAPATLRELAPEGRHDVPAPAAVDPGPRAVAALPPLEVTAPVVVEEARPAARWSPPGAASLLALGYAIVAAVLLVRLAVSLNAVRRLTRESVAIPEGPWVEAVGLWSGRLGLRRTVRLARAARLGGPVVVGWLRPTIVLPEALAESAAPGVIDAVVVHELAHVRRGDYGWNLLLRVVQAAYWPQPLVWLLGPIVASVREQACDELCVYWTGDARGYRATLLAIAESLVKRPREALGLAMSRPTRLGRRLAHLATTRGASRCVLRGPARGAVVVLVVAAVGLLGSIRLARTAAAQPPPAEKAEKSEAKSAPRADQPEPKAKADPEPKAAEPPAPPEANDEPKPGDGVLNVTVEKPRREPWARLAMSPCTMQMLSPSPVHARVAGIVAAKGLASVGDPVKKGDLLAEIEASDLPVELGKARAGLRQANSRRKQAVAAVGVARATVEGARARIDEAKIAVQQALDNVTAQTRQVERIKVLVRTNVVSHEEADMASEKLRAAENGATAAASRLRAAQAALAQAEAEQKAAEAGVDAVESDVQDAQAEVDRIEARFGFTKIVSPIDGIVYKRNVEAGSPALPDQETPLFVVARTDVLTTSVTIDESQAALIRPGQPALIRRRSGTQTEAIRTEVRRIGAEVQQGMVRVDIDVPNPEGRLRPGSAATALILLGPPHEAITVPASVLKRAEDRLGNNLDEAVCYRVSGGRAVETPVTLGLSDGSRFEVVKGLKGDETLVADLVDTAGNVVNLPSNSYTAQFRGSPRVRVVDIPHPSSPLGRYQAMTRGMGMGGGFGGMSRMGFQGSGLGGSPAGLERVPVSGPRRVPEGNR